MSSTTTTTLVEQPSASKQHSVLTVSLARHLVGHDITHVLNQAWSPDKVDFSVRSKFNNTGFNLDPKNVSSTLQELENVLSKNDWDGVLIGWCLRGHAEFTDLFESVVTVCTQNIVKRAKDGEKEPKLLFCTGPEDLVNASLRSFPE